MSVGWAQLTVKYAAAPLVSSSTWSGASPSGWPVGEAPVGLDREGERGGDAGLPGGWDDADFLLERRDRQRRDQLHAGVGENAHLGTVQLGVPL
jgi:hypothetical protein